jgi:ribonuclease PH
VALNLALRKLQAQGKLPQNPIAEQVAAVSVGVVNGKPLLDLCYLEDAAAAVDMNLVMTATGRYIELQGSGEEATFSREELDALLVLGRQGIDQLVALQTAALAAI